MPKAGAWWNGRRRRDDRLENAGTVPLRLRSGQRSIAAQRQNAVDLVGLIDGQPGFQDGNNSVPVRQALSQLDPAIRTLIAVKGADPLHHLLLLQPLGPTFLCYRLAKSPGIERRCHKVLPISLSDSTESSWLEPELEKDAFDRSIAAKRLI